MKIKTIVLILMLLNAFLAYTASVNVDELKILADTHYNPDSRSVENTTYFKFVTSFDGGYKFSAKVAFEANTKELEKSYLDSSADFYNKVFMLFRSAEVSARNLLDSHLSLSFWTGTYKYLGQSNIYKGYLYYPESQDKDFCGFYRLRGTGISTQIKFWNDRFRSEFHFFENTNFISSRQPNAFFYFTFVAQTGLYFEEIQVENEFFNLAVEIFAGITFPVNRYQQYFTGLSFSVGNQYLDFTITGGLPKINPDTDSNAYIGNITFHDVYMSADFHFKLAITDHTISFLTRPIWFNEKENTENNVDFDVYYKFLAKTNFPISGGFILNFQYALSNLTDPWHLYFSPYMDITFSGIKWSFAAHYDFSRIYVGNLNNYNSAVYLSGCRFIISASTSF